MEPPLDESQAVLTSWMGRLDALTQQLEAQAALPEPVEQTPEVQQYEQQLAEVLAISTQAAREARHLKAVYMTPPARTSKASDPHGEWLLGRASTRPNAPHSAGAVAHNNDSTRQEACDTLSSWWLGINS